MAAQVQRELNKEHLQRATVSVSLKGKIADNATHKKAAREDLYVQTFGKFANRLNAPLSWVREGKGRLAERTHTQSAAQWEKLEREKNSSQTSVVVAGPKKSLR